MLKGLLSAKLLPGLAVLGVLVASFIAGPLGLFGSLAGYGYGSCGYGYAYTGTPVVSSVSPSFGSTAGGTFVTITGSGFCNTTTAVTFGGTASLPNVISDTQITTNSPAHAAGTVDVIVTTAGGTSPISAADHYTFIAAAAGNFTPVTPTRVLDTRLSGPRLGPGASRILPFAGISVPANASAVVINVTATDTTSNGFFTVYPTAGSLPLASNLNWVHGQTVPNLVMVNLGAGGAVTIYNGAGKANAVVDLEGYYSPTAGTGFAALPPVRITDTRTGSGQPNAGSHLGAGGSLAVQITGAGGVASTALAVVLNVTVTNTTASSFITAFPTGAARPLASNLNWVRFKTIANRVVVPIGTAGKVTFYNGVGSADIVIDVNGYFTDSASSGAQFVGVTPSRILDTRIVPGTRVASGGTIVVPVAGIGGVPAMGSATPPTSVVLNVTATNPTLAGFLTVFPDGTARPLASDLNFLRGQTVPNLVVVKIGASGSVDVYNGNGRTHVVIDVVGWFG